MKKILYLFSLIFLLNGCVETISLLGSTAGGAANGKLLQSSLQSSLSYGIKKHTGKTPLGHVLAYNEKNNPDRKKETCISFIEKTRSEFCSIAKKKLSLTKKAVKEKIATNLAGNPKTTKKDSLKTVIKPKNKGDKKIAFKPEAKSFLKNLNYINSEKSPRELAIIFQTKLKKIKNKYIK